MQLPANPKDADWGPALEFLRPGRRLLLSTHLNPDGDALGSLAAMARLLVTRGCEVFVVSQGPLPEVYAFLFEDFPCPLCWDPEQADLPENLDGCLILDVSTMHRIGGVGPLLQNLKLPLMVVDHHISNDIEEGLLYAFPQIGSTGEVLWELLRAMQIRPDQASAEALYVSISTDTGGFSFPATRAETLEMAAALVHLGVVPAHLHELVNQRYPLARFQLMGRYLASMERHAEGELLVFRITAEMLAETGATRQLSEGFVNMGLSVQGCRMTLTFSDTEEGGTKLNFRCKEPYDVNAVASCFGGGGHRFAAGASLKEARTTVEGPVLEATLSHIRETKGRQSAKKGKNA